MVQENPVGRRCRTGRIVCTLSLSQTSRDIPLQKGGGDALRDSDRSRGSLLRRNCTGGGRSAHRSGFVGEDTPEH